ncbi:MAG: hypothetical protein KF812_02420 [Fimbriimonadaceae bacterium]|nr:hypothetical protein [Fimbriimonadaceae bacterium]
MSIVEFFGDAARSVVATILCVLGLAGVIGGVIWMQRTDVQIYDVLAIGLIVIGGIFLLLGILKYFFDR